MKSFKDYQPSPAPDERETLARAVTEPDPALESSAAELTKKIAAAYNGKSSADMFRNILSEAEKASAQAPFQTRRSTVFTSSFPRFSTTPSAASSKAWSNG